MQKTYYPINEAAAKRAHDMMSFSDYPENSKTNEYRGMVDDVYSLAEKVAAENRSALMKQLILLTVTQKNQLKISTRTQKSVAVVLL